MNWCIFFISLILNVPYSWVTSLVIESDKIKLFDIDSLVFKKNERVTTKQASEPNLQLQCIGGTFGCNLTPDTVECFNRGNNGKNIKWVCNADLPQIAKIGQINVTCESYDRQSDSFVLANSCGLKYTLETVETKEEKSFLSNSPQFYSKAKLSEINSLIFKKDALTTFRRTSPIQQLQCIGGSAMCSYLPDIFQCQNKGFDGVSQQWDCKPNYLPIEFKLGEAKVSCEGYDSSNDTSILVGSCGLKYTINKDKGSSNKIKGFSTIIGVVLGGLFLLACCIIIPICCCLKCLCFKNCSGGSQGTNHQNYAYQPTPQPPGVVYYPQTPTTHYSSNTNGGNTYQESSGFATTETR